MRTERILHPELAKAIATLGHGDIILVTDAGFPIPADANRIDLGIYPGQIDVLELLKILRSEIFVEDIQFAPEVRDINTELYESVREIYKGHGATFTAVSHEDLCNEVAPMAKLVIRSGSLIPWANFAMVASTDPFAWFTEESGVAPLPNYIKRRKQIQESEIPKLV